MQKKGEPVGKMEGKMFRMTNIAEPTVQNVVTQVVSVTKKETGTKKMLQTETEWGVEIPNGTPHATDGTRMVLVT